MWAGRQAEEPPNPHPSLTKGCFPIVFLEGSGLVNAGGVGGGREKKQQEEAAQWDEVRSSLHSSSVLSGFLQQPLPSSVSVDAFQLSYEL